MNPIKTLKLIAAVAALPMIFSACNKTLQEPKDESDVEMYTSSTSTSLTTVCNSPTITLRLGTEDENNYFFIPLPGQNPNLNPDRQNFLGADFSNTSLIRVSAVGGNPYHLGLTGIGVAGPGESGSDMHSINPGEELQLSVGTAFSKNFRFTGFDFILGGKPSTGRVECMYGNQVMATVPFTKAGYGNQTLSFKIPNNRGASGMASFKMIRIICESGSVFLRGPYPRPVNSTEPPTRIYFANFTLPIAMCQTGSTTNMLGYTNTFINRGIAPGGEQSLPDYELTRQYRVQLPMRTVGSGDYTLTNPDKWLKVRATGGELVYAHGALGVGQEGGTRVNNKDWSIDNNESIVIEPGTDFPSQYFAVFEFRSDNDATGEGLDWEAYDGSDMVASGTTPGNRNVHNRISPHVKFNKVIIKGKSATSRSRVGMGGGRVMVAYPLCQ